MRLNILICPGNYLEGSIPTFSSTFDTLVLRHNQLESVPHLNLLNPFMSEMALMLLDHNRLSCRLPADNPSRVKAALVAVGNRVIWSGSAEELPSYVFPYERDGVLWQKRDAGLWLLGKVLMGFGALMIAFLSRVGCRSYVGIL